MSKQKWVVEITTTSVYQLDVTSEKEAITTATGMHQDRDFTYRVDLYVDGIDSYSAGASDDEEGD